MKHIVVAAVVATLSVGWITAQALPGWIEAGRGGRLAGEMTFANSAGRLGVLFTAGSVETTGHPFFTPLGSKRPRVRHLPSTGERDEPLGVDDSRALAGDRRTRSVVRRD